MCSLLRAQTITQSREARLEPGGYPISGSAFLELYDDGTLTLRLTEDYSTDAGPDVQLFLSNHPTNVGAGFMVANLSEGRLFDGAQSWNIDNVDISDYNFIIFRCIAFNQHWAGGSFGMVTDSGGGNGGGGMMEDDCLASATATTDWVDRVSICLEDGEPDLIPLKNTLGVSAGDTYAYIITDEEDRIIEISRNDTFDFETLDARTNRVYGASYTGILTFQAGDNWRTISSTGCVELSNPDTYLTVTKDGCPMECQTSAVATTNWVPRVEVCATDGKDDYIQLKNTLGISAGENYAYVVTNSSLDIIAVVMQDSFNFEGTGLATNRVYGISYSGALTYTRGDTWNTIRAEDCIEYSDSDVYLTVGKNCTMTAPECFETTVASEAWQTDFDICPNDGQSDSIFIQNNLFIAPGDTYVFVRTDENQRIKELISDEWFDFEGSGLGEDRIYGLSYEGTLSTFTPGDDLSTLTADGCATLSSQELFIKVTKNGCQAQTGSISGRVTDYKGDGVSNVTLSLNTGANATTNSDGNYTFQNLPLNTFYSITPSKTDNFGNGVTAQDLVIMQRHILGIQTIRNPYLLVSGDANKDNRISAVDIVNFQNIIIGFSSELANNTAWRFVPGSTPLGSSDPFNFIEKDAVDNLTGDVTDLNFIAIKTGDVSGNASVD